MRRYRNDRHSTRGCTEGKGFYTIIITSGYMAYDKYDYDRETDYSSGKNPKMEDESFNGERPENYRRGQTMGLLVLLALLLLGNLFFNSI